MEILNKSEHRAIGGGGGLKIGKNSERNLWMAPYRILGRVPKQQNNNAALHDVAHNLKGACIILVHYLMHYLMQLRVSYLSKVPPLSR